MGSEGWWYFCCAISECFSHPILLWWTLGWYISLHSPAAWCSTVASYYNWRVVKVGFSLFSIVLVLHQGYTLYSKKISLPLRIWYQSFLDLRTSNSGFLNWTLEALSKRKSSRIAVFRQANGRAGWHFGCKLATRRNIQLLCRMMPPVVSTVI